jgi:hypothetical protein
MSDHVEELLGEIRDELKGIRLAIERQPVRAADPSVLVRAIATHAGGRVFTSAELCQHAALPEALALREAIVAAVEALNPRRLGRYLRRIEGQPFEGVYLQRCGDDRDGLVWQLAQVSVRKALSIA